MNNSNFGVVDFGAVADGKTVNTKAIQAAVDACATAGGGRVEVPAGTFVSGSIFLKSNVEFHLMPGALLQGSADLADYELLDLEGHGYRSREWCHAALLNTCSCENVAITGTGTFDGCGPVWWAAKNRISDYDAAVQKKDDYRGIRPPLLFFWDSRRIKVRDVKLQNSPMYAMLSVCCQDMVIDGVNIENPWKPYNNCDGIDILSCKDVRVSNCHIDNGDDGICLKTLPGWFLLYGPDETGKWDQDLDKPHLPCENILVENCVVRHAHTGFAIWAEVSGGMSNVAVNNCVFDGSRNGIQIARWQYPGGYVRNCRFDNILMHRVETAILISSTAVECDTEAPGRGAPEFHDISLTNITGSRVQTACMLIGSAKGSVHHIDLRHIRMKSDLGFVLENVRDIRIEAVDLACRNVPLAMRDVDGLEVTGFNAKPSTPAIPVIEAERVRDAWIHGCTAAAGTGTFLGEPKGGNDIRLEGNHLGRAMVERGPVEPENRWNMCCHAFTGSRWIRDSGKRNLWLPMPPAVEAFVRGRWTQEQIDGIWSVSRVEANSRDGAETGWQIVRGGESNIEGRELRCIYIIQSRFVDERLIVFEDGEFLRAIDDPNFHAHFEERRDDFELPRIDREARERGDA